MSGEIKFEKLFSPFRLGQINLKNRIVMSAMSVGFATPDGYIPDNFVDYFEERAKGGVGLITVGYASVEYPRGNTDLCRIVIDDDKYIPGLKRLVETVKQHGAKIALQLNHAGGFCLKSQTGYEPIAPSPVIIRPRGDKPREMTLAEISYMVECFARGAERAVRAGFDAVEIHAATAYLINQFLSPYTNRRKDDYGGSLKNRARFLLEVVRAIKAAVGSDYPLWAKVNAVEFGVSGGITLDDTKELSKMLQKEGCSAIHIGVYGRMPPWSSMAEPFGSNIHYAAAIKKVIDMPVIVIGRNIPQVAERALQELKADLIAIGRGLLADPELPLKAASGRLEDIRYCLACDNCKAGVTSTCTVNASVGREREYRLITTDKPKTVVVVGGGPAGLEAARIAALRGHQVILYEKKRRLGGRLRLACKMPGEKSIELIMKYLVPQVTKAGVRVELGKDFNVAMSNKVKPDALILATGSKIPLLGWLAAIIMVVLGWKGLRQGRGPMFRSREGKSEIVGAHSVFLMAAQSEGKLYADLVGKVPEIYRVGDCIDPFGIGEAIASGASVGRRV